MAFEDDGFCFVCGGSNPDGLRLKFQLTPDKTLITSFTPEKKFQGYKNITHGGILGLLFDEMMVNLPWKLGRKAVTAEFKVRLKRPHPVGERLDLICRIQEENTKLIRLKATAHDASDHLVAEAEGICVKVK